MSREPAPPTGCGCARRTSPSRATWARTICATLGNPDREREFADYVRRIAEGAPADVAFGAAFSNPGKLEGELGAYINQLSVRVAQYLLDDGVTGRGAYALTRMTPGEVETAIGFQLFRQQRFSEARARFEKALAADPDTGPARTGLGLLLVQDGQPAEGLRDLRKGAELNDGDAFAHCAFGYEADQCTTEECLAAQGGRDTAVRELRRAVELYPEYPEALYMLGWVESKGGTDFAAAERHMLQAIAYQPGREDYRINLAQVYLRQGKDPQVQQLLGPIVASSPNAGNKEVARQLLGAMARMRAAREALAAARAAAAADPLPGGAASTPAGPPAGAGTPPGDAPSGPPRTTPVYRKTGEDERRGLRASCLRSSVPPAPSSWWSRTARPRAGSSRPRSTGSSSSRTATT